MILLLWSQTWHTSFIHLIFMHKPNWWYLSISLHTCRKTYQTTISKKTINHNHMFSTLIQIEAFLALFSKISNVLDHLPSFLSTFQLAPKWLIISFSNKYVVYQLIQQELSGLSTYLESTKWFNSLLSHSLVSQAKTRISGINIIICYFSLTLKH